MATMGKHVLARIREWVNSEEFAEWVGDEVTDMTFNPDQCSSSDSVSVGCYTIKLELVNEINEGNHG